MKLKENKIIVIGSTNMDMVVKTSHIPIPGETVLGGSFFMNPGGKGANQAVAVARLRGDVIFITKIGEDIFGKRLAQLFDEEGMAINGLISDTSSASGVALITVDKSGENSIVVAPGANARLSAAEVEKCLNKEPAANIMLMQLEIPMETVKFAATYAAERNICVVLNPAPANELTAELLGLIDIITPNVNEAEMLSGISVTGADSARKAAESIRDRGVKNVVITMGKMGAAVLEAGKKFQVVPAPVVEAVDTTAAGDAFNAALCVALSEGKALADAAFFGCQAASIAVTRMGAQAAMPYRNELVMKRSIRR